LLSEPNQTQLVGTLASLQKASDRIATLAQSIEPGAKNLPALADDARQMMTSANGVLRDMAPVLQEAKTTLVAIDKLAREYASRAEALDRVAKSSEQIGGASQSVASAVSGDVTPRVNALLDELARNSRNLDRLLSELNEQPAGLVFGRTPGRPGPGESGFTPPVKGR